MRPELSEQQRRAARANLEHRHAVTWSPAALAFPSCRRRDDPTLKPPAGSRYRCLLDGDFTEAEIAELERAYGVPVQRPARAAEPSP